MKNSSDWIVASDPRGEPVLRWSLDREDDRNEEAKPDPLEVLDITAISLAEDAQQGYDPYNKTTAARSRRRR
jgi:hypothetical protein